MKYILEYVWIDGTNIRSKIKVVNMPLIPILETLDFWNFDGSSTGQTSGPKSDIILKPIRLYNNPFLKDGYLILCECYNTDMTPHKTNTRFKCSEYVDTQGFLFGIEQEYILMDRYDIPLQWRTTQNPGMGNQGPYYCSVGGDRAFGRHISNAHLQACIEAGIDICGTNSEVMASQWEYQIGICTALKVSDDLWMSRYILHQITEKYNCYATFYPKIYDEWNGTGGHTNVSTGKMREPGGITAIIDACKKLEKTHFDHMLVYGIDNNKRLSGKYETSNIDRFTYGISNRNCSVRIPVHVQANQCGYLEDRRPAGNLDPYLVTFKLMESIGNNID